MSKEKQAANGKRAWTAQEDTTIRRMRAEGHTLAEIGSALNRPKGSVCTRADRLGLSKPREGLNESRIGTIVHPKPGVLIHYAREAGK